MPLPRCYIFCIAHLEGTKAHPRLWFIDFSSAFNTIQPHLLADKLIHFFNLDLNLVGWILDFLTVRSQCVRVNGSFSNQLQSSTGSPQGWCLSPLHYIFYTNDCRSNHSNRQIIKFADDSVVVSLLEGDGLQHGPVVDDFVSWCDESFLQLNVTKTKDMLISFGKAPPCPVLTSINGTEIELVDSYKYLGVVLDKKLCFDPHVAVTTKKVHQHLYFPRKMSSFNVSSEMMTLFYRSFIESVLIFCIIAWYGNLTVANKNRLGSLINVASKISGRRQAHLIDLYKRQVIKKATSIQECLDHPLQTEFELLPTGRRLRVPLIRTNRYRVSFVPAAILMLNNVNNSGI